MASRHSTKMPSCSMHSGYFERKALQRDDKYSEQFKIKAEITTIIVPYLEIKALCPKRVIYHQQF